jgi:hypothetical protein
LGTILKIGYDFENLILKDSNSETGRRRRSRRRRRRFVVPRPGTTLSHLVKTWSREAKILFNYSFF